MLNMIMPIFFNKLFDIWNIIHPRVVVLAQKTNAIHITRSQFALRVKKSRNFRFDAPTQLKVTKLVEQSHRS